MTTSLLSCELFQYSTNVLKNSTKRWVQIPEYSTVLNTFAQTELRPVPLKCSSVLGSHRGRSLGVQFCPSADPRKSFICFHTNEWKKKSKASSSVFPAESSQDQGLVHNLQRGKIPIRSGKPADSAPNWRYCVTDRSGNQSKLCFHAVGGA